MLLLVLSPWDLAVSLSFADSRGATFGRFVQEWGRFPARPLVVCGAIALAVKSIRAAYPLAMRASAALIAQFLLHAGLLTNLLKLLFGRPRPVHLGPGGESFIGLGVLNPGLGDFSFPSGHVAVAMIAAPCALLLWRDGRRRAAVAIATLTLGWSVAVALGRVLYGAHFLTDVAFSIGSGVAIAPLSLGLGERLLRRLAPEGRSR